MRTNRDGHSWDPGSCSNEMSSTPTTGGRKSGGGKDYCSSGSPPRSYR